MLRLVTIADMMIGAALFNVRQTGLDQQQAVREKLAQLACYRETIHAHLTAAIALAQPSPAGLLMPNHSLLYTGRVQACTQLPAMMHIARELCGGQICVTPDAANFDNPETGPWLEKYYSVNENWVAEDRRKLLTVCPSERGLQQLRFLRPARLRAPGGRAVRQSDEAVATRDGAASSFDSLRMRGRGLSSPHGEPVEP